MKELVLAAILSLARGPVAADRARLEAIADDVTAAAQAPGAPVVFDGTAGREATALLLVAIAAHESGFAPDIDRCERLGDGGRSRTMWQLIGDVHLKGTPADVVCKDRRVAARLALDAVAEMRARRPGATPQELLNAYASGDPLLETPQSRRTCSMWQTRAQRLGLLGAYCHKRFPIARREVRARPRPCVRLPLAWRDPAVHAQRVAPLAPIAALPLPVPPPSPFLLAARFVPAVVLTLPACQGNAPAGEAVPQAPASAAPLALPPARRPARKWYFERTRERCEVYFVEAERVSTPRPAPCPADLHVGERIRLAGMTCVLESSSDPSRQHPVVCPDALTNEEKWERANGSRAR